MIVTGGTGYLGIVEVGDLCARMRARNLDLFEQLGAWVVDTSDPASQRLFAEAAHRHAWHAELWAQRAPAIPAVDLDMSTARPPAVPGPAAERIPLYTVALDELIDDLRTVGARVDVLLDPSTVRTIDLVMVDLLDLQSRLSSC